MTIKARGATRAMFFASTSMMPMLRGPAIAYAPDEPEGGGGSGDDDTPEEFREQPGDREPEPETEGSGNEDGNDGGDGNEEDAQGGDEEGAPAEGDTDGDGAQDGAEEGGEEGGADEEQEPPERQLSWKDRQIKKLRDQQAEKDKKIEEATKRAEAAEALLAGTPEERAAAAGGRTEEQIRRDVEAQVRQEAYYKGIDKGLTAMDEAGKKAFPKTWNSRIEQAREAFRDEMIARPDFLEALTDLPNSAQVYHDLTGDPDRLEAMLKMPAHKMGMELARLSDKVGTPPPPKPISRAPAPIKPLTPKGGERTLEELMNDPKASQTEINARMDAEERKRAKAAAER